MLSFAPFNIYIIKCFRKKMYICVEKLSLIKWHLVLEPNSHIIFKTLGKHVCYDKKKISSNDCKICFYHEYEYSWYEEMLPSLISLRTEL